MSIPFDPSNSNNPSLTFASSNTPQFLDAWSKINSNLYNTSLASVSIGTTQQTFSLKSMHYLVSEIIFVFRSNDALNSNDYFNYSNSAIPANKANPIDNIQLIFDGRDRIKKMSASVFTQLEPTKVHTNTPINKFIHVYSFSLEPEKIEQPNGVMNFSEIQEPLLHIGFNGPSASGTLYVYAVNYNVLMATSGAGLVLHQLSKSIPSVFPM